MIPQRSPSLWGLCNYHSRRYSSQSISLLSLCSLTQEYTPEFPSPQTASMAETKLEQSRNDLLKTSLQVETGCKIWKMWYVKYDSIFSLWSTEDLAYRLLNLTRFLVITSITHLNIIQVKGRIQPLSYLSIIFQF